MGTVYDHRASSEDSATLGHVRWGAGIQGNADVDEPIHNFGDYATIFWAAHCELCGESRRKDGQLKGYLYTLLRESDLKAPTGKFNRWIADVQKLVSQVPSGFYDQQIEKELDCCISLPPTPFRVYCAYGLTETVKTLCPPPNPSDSENGTPDAARGYILHGANESGLTGLHMESIFGRTETVKHLIKLNSPQLWLPDNKHKTALYYAVEAAETNTEIVELLLDAYAKKCDPRSDANKYSVDSDVLVAAMRDGRLDNRLVEILMGSQNSGEYRPFPDENRTFDLSVAAATYRYTSLALIKTVLSPENVTEDIFVAVAGSSSGAGVEWAVREEIWEYMMAKFESEQTRILEAVVESADTDLACYLTSFRPPDKILEAAASSTRRPYELMHALLVGCCYRISSAIIERALKNPTADINLIAKLRVLGSATRTKTMLTAIAVN
jgi:hypothetical protein